MHNGIFRAYHSMRNTDAGAIIIFAVCLTVRLAYPRPAGVKCLSIYKSDRLCTARTAVISRSTRFDVQPNGTMQLRHLRTFVAVAATLNFTRAAEQVHLAQSSVSEQIQSLEADLGTALFDRSRRELQLTFAGQRLLEYAESLLAIADEARTAVADAGNAIAGQVTIGGLETLCATLLPGLIAAFCTQYPETAVTVKSGNSGDLRAGIKTGELDVCFILGTTEADPAVQYAHIAQERLVIVVPPSHRLAGCDSIGPEDLAGESFLVTESGCVYRRMFDQTFPAHGPRRPRLAGEFGSIAAILGLVESGIGCALVPCLAAADAVSNGRLVALPWVGEHQTVPITMFWRHSSTLRPAISRFLELAQTGRVPLMPVAARHQHAVLSR